MTISEQMMGRITARGLDVELLDRLGVQSGPHAGGEALCIPFYRHGKLVRRKYRYWDREDGRRWLGDKGTVSLPWNEDCLLDSSLASQPLIVTEGEFDAMSAIQCGYHRTISVPDGAPTPAERDLTDIEKMRKYAWLVDLKPLLSRENCPEIILAVDADDNGAALLHDLSLAFGRARCKFVTYPVARDPVARGRPRLKDLNEVLEDYGQRGVIEVINRAQWLKIDGVYKMSELPPSPVRRIYEIGFELFGENFKLRMGDFSVWTGTPGSGKTTLVQDIGCRLADLYGLKSGWASFEQAPQSDHRRAFREWYAHGKEWSLPDHAIAQADVWIDDHFVFLVPSEDEDATLEWLLDKMEVAVTRHGVKLIVIDPWNEMDHYVAGRENEVTYINRAIKTIRRFARSHMVHVAVVAHPTKLQKLPDGKYPPVSLYDIHGGAVWHNKADLGVIVARVSDTDALVKTAKSRYHDLIGRPGSVVMQYCADDRRFRETERPLTPGPKPLQTPKPAVDLLDPDVALPQIVEDYDGAFD